MQDHMLLQVSFQDLKYNIQIPLEYHVLPNVLRSAINTLKWLSPTTWYSAIQARKKGEHVTTFSSLQGCTGNLKPGSMTLLIAPPGMLPL